MLEGKVFFLFNDGVDLPLDAKIVSDIKSINLIVFVFFKNITILFNFIWLFN
ncbi:Uncharacterised protein [Mycobacteroides abscessus]|nr:Uncharacterised protein [Mycobacteroides abscessus]